MEEIKKETVDKKKEPSRIKKSLNKIRSNRKRYALGLGIVCAAMVAIAAIASAIYSLHPYAIAIDGEPVCHVKSEAVATKTIDALMTDYAADDSTVKAIGSMDRLTLVKEPLFSVDEADMVSAKNAVDIIKKASETGSDKPLEIIVAGTQTTVEPYTPDPDYERDDSMLAGQSEVIKEGVDGTQEVSRTVLTKNGNVTDTKVTATKVIDEGSPAHIKKGTIGLPEGENWETYEGYPEFKDGSEMAQYSKNYLGAPYKYGGYSLTNGIDCVQFVRAMYKKYGIKLPNDHPGLRRVGVGVSLKDAKAGDIVCYSPHHVALYLGDGKIIHATRKKGVRISKVNIGSKKLLTIRRVAQ